MKIKKVKNDKNKNSEIRYEVIIPMEKINEEIKSEYDKNKKFMQVPGFRKGKVPYEIGIKVYGKDAFFSDVIQNLIAGEISQELEKEIEKENMKLLSIIDMEMNDEINLDEDKEISLVLISAVTSEIDVKGMDKLEVSQKDIDEAKLDVKKETEKRINDELNKNASYKKVEDKKYKVKEGDKVTLSFKGSIKDENGKDKYFEGGTSDSYELEIGSKSFIDGFEDQIVGLKLGDKKDVIVTFPKEYQEKSLQGKEAKFEVEILDILEKDIVELDDEFAKDLGFDSLKDLKEDYKKKIEEENKKIEKNFKIAKAIEELLKKNEIEISEKYTHVRAHNEFDQMKAQYKGQGLDLDLMLPHEEQHKYIAEMENEIVNNLKMSVLVNSLIKQLKVKVGKKELEKELEGYNKNYNLNIKFDELDKEYKSLKENLELAAKEKKVFDEIEKEIKIKK